MTAAARGYVYELGRARGAACGRTAPTERDWEWLRPDGWVSPAEEQDFEDGMLDGAEQADCARIGLAGTAPPSAEAIAAARDM